MNTISIGTKGTVQQTINSRFGSEVITRHVEVIEWDGDIEMAEGLVRVQYTDDTAAVYGARGFERADEISVD